MTVLSQRASAFDLTGTTALVTGGNGGIGLGIAEGLALAGADVAIWGTNQGKLQAARRQLEAQERRVVALVCDVTDEDAVANAFEQTTAELGPIDSCFANAGLLRSTSRFVDMSLSEWRSVLQVNLDGTFLVLRAASQHMIDHQRGGSLVVTSSISALHGHPHSEHYAVAKAGQLALVRSLAVELARYSIRVNAILPGWVETGLSGPLFAGDRFGQHVLPRIPSGRSGEPMDFAGIAVYLASPASSYHTGDAIVVDGGYSIF